MNNKFKNKKIILYYQTLIDLNPLIKLVESHNKISNTPLLTHITLASIHFGYEEDKITPYIHLNNNNPSDSIFKEVFENLKILKSMGIKINILLGGAGGAFNMLFSNFDNFYKLFKDFIKNEDIFDGINLDIEEEVNINDIVLLVNELKSDFPEKCIIFAPLAYSLISNEPGMGGFVYRDLMKMIGDKVDYFNVQCYDDYSLETLDQIISNNYDSEKIVMGMLFSQNFNSIIIEINKIVKKYKNKFGGVAIWEYFNAPPSQNKPYVWCEIMNNLLYN